MSVSKRANGDYQTPEAFAQAICHYLHHDRGLRPVAVLEPTCGLGHLLQASMIFDAQQYIGIELNPEYCTTCRNTLTDPSVTIHNADIFGFATRKLFSAAALSGPILILGNPPWVTSATLSALGATQPPKQSAASQGLQGLAALTGESNFDLATAIIMQLIHEYRDSQAYVAMLCKTSVARKVFQEIKRLQIGFKQCELLEFDAHKVFGIDAHACLLLIELDPDTASSPDSCTVYDWQPPQEPQRQYSCGYLNGRFYSQIPCGDQGTATSTVTPYEFDGTCCLPWRQGLKHDCAALMELTLDEHGHFSNGLKEPVQVENEYIFPLVKGSHFKAPIISSFKKHVLVTQRQLREDTAHLQQDAPLFWKYLSAPEHYARFAARKSSIYRGAPDFSLFGIGPYTFAPFKVGISGFAKKPLFALLYSPDGNPVMTDDTCYFLSFSSYETAYVTMLLLNSPQVQAFLPTMTFLDAKRPYSKKVLSRIDLEKVAAQVSFAELQQTESQLGLKPVVTNAMFNYFRQWLSSVH